jgi:hypothetical protein
VQLQIRQFLERQRLRRLQPKPLRQSSASWSKLILTWQRFFKDRRFKRRDSTPTIFNSLFRSSSFEQISISAALVRVLRSSSLVFIQLSLIPLVLNAFPIRLSNPSWYLQLISSLAESAPALILAFVVGFISLLVDQPSDSSIAYHGRLVRSSRLFSWLLVLLIPAQIGLSAWFVGTVYSEFRAQSDAINTQSNALIAAAQLPTTKQEFLTFARSRNIPANSAAIDAATLPQVKTVFTQMLQLEGQKRRQALGAELRSTLIQFSLDTVELLATLVVFVVCLASLHLFASRSLKHSLAAINSSSSESTPTP